MGEEREKEREGRGGEGRKEGEVREVVGEELERCMREGRSGCQLITCFR